MFTISQVTIVTTLSYPHRTVSSLAFSKAKFFCPTLRACLLTGQECYPAPTVMKAIYLRGNLSSPKCSDPILAMQLCFLCTPCLSAITGPRNWSILPFGFGVLGHQNIPTLHTVERQPPAYRIHCKITCHQMQEESICSLYTQPEIFSHECHFSTWLSSKNKGLQYYHVVTSKASSPSDSHFRCEKHDEK